ncbi:hypothetical protein M569_17350, partial [Genlisea aurea]
SMADTSENQLNNGEREDRITKEPENPTPIRTPASIPEKPLPGDCCGSGCLRCVWDIYYEELEEYNR